MELINLLYSRLVDVKHGQHQGEKAKAHFLKPKVDTRFINGVDLFKRTCILIILTSDNRLVLKEMVSSWNVAERDALLRFAPKYFTYLKTSAGVSDLSLQVVVHIHA